MGRELFGRQKMNMKVEWYEDTPVRRAEVERYNSQSEETKKILDEIDTSEAFQLKVIKRTRPKLAKGDVFALNPFGDTYFYGVVLNPGFNHRTLGDNLITICLLKTYSNEISAFEFKDQIKEIDVLIGPFIISKSCWSMGLFYNIGINIDEKMEIEYGFYSSRIKKYVNEREECLEIIPKLKEEAHSVWSDIGITYALNRELVMNNSFLDEETRRAFFEHLKQASEQEPPKREPSEFEKGIPPFMFDKEHSRRFSVTLTDLQELQYIFENAEYGNEGNGYDWECLIKALIKDKFPEAKRKIKFDSEAGMFYMYCSDESLIKAVITCAYEEIKKNGIIKYMEFLES